MGFKTIVTDKMHCPKCGQNYPEGYQRFCDTDGARLVPDAAETRSDTGVFASILSKSQPADTGYTFTDIPRFVVSEGERPDARLRLKDQQTAAMFFDEEPELELSSDAFVIVDEPIAKPVGRRIDPSEIPSGHVDLDERELTAAHFNEFDIDAPDDFVGKTVKGRYLVTELIGEDDSGFSYFGEDRIIGDKPVVIHILTFSGQDEITRSIFDEERVSLSHLNHPNVARLIDSGSYTNGTTFLISEHTEGLTVDDILQIHGRFASDRAARIIKQAAYALSDVHNESVLHRDIHPINITIAPSETEAEAVKITNFGVSSGEPNSGNLAYQAPESLDGRIPTVASDIYSLAVVAYEMLTGLRPFDGETEKELRQSQRSGNLPLPTSIIDGLSPDVDFVFSKALAGDPRARYFTAREFGEAFFAAATKRPQAEDTLPVYDAEIVVTEDVPAIEPPKPETRKERAVPYAEFPNYREDGPAWTRRSPEAIAEPNSRWLKVAGLSFAAFLILLAGAWYYLINRPVPPVFQPGDLTVQNRNTSSTLQVADTIVPPLERNIPQPPNTEYYANHKQNLTGDLLRNFVGFKLYYPKDWKVNGAAPSTTAGSRGKFLDISKSTPEGKLREQMLISYYPSKGTYPEDTPAFPQLVKETNETLKKMIPSYQMLSEGQITVNGGWQAYEIKFQFSVKPETSEPFVVWGRRLFIPAQRPGVRNGFEVTMLATSYAESVHSVDDVGVNGELAAILESFEPSQNF